MKVTISLDVFQGCQSVMAMVQRCGDLQYSPNSPMDQAVRYLVEVDVPHPTDIPKDRILPAKISKEP